MLTLVFGLPQGYWAVISVIIVMQANLGGSLRAGWMRIIGTSVGAALGVACLLVFGHGVISLGVSVGLTILICAYFTHLHESFRLAGMTACIIIFMSHQETDVVMFGITRFLEITLGVAVALVVSLFVFPSRAGFQLSRGVVRALYDEADFYSILLACRTPGACQPQDEKLARQALEATRTRNRALLAEAKREPAGFSRSGHITVSLYNFTERIAEHLLSMDLAIHGQELEPLHEKLAQTMDMLAQTTLTAMTSLALAIAHRPRPRLPWTAWPAPWPPPRRPWAEVRQASAPWPAWTWIRGDALLQLLLQPARGGHWSCADMAERGGPAGRGLGGRIGSGRLFGQVPGQGQKFRSLGRPWQRNAGG